MIWDLANPSIPSKILRGHTGTVHTLAIASNKRTLVSIGYETDARIWDLSEPGGEECRRVLKGHTDKLYAVAVDQDGGKVVTGSADGTAVIWDIDSGYVYPDFLVLPANLIYAHTYL